MFGKIYNKERQMEEIVIRVGDFLKEHINNIVNMCNDNPIEFENLQNVEYAKTTFGLRANYSFFKKLSLFNDNPNIRYYAQDYYINGEKYRLTSQFGGNAIIEGKTTSQYQGEKIYEYLKIYNLLLDKYENKKIIFIAGNNNENTINQENNFALKFNPLNQILYGSPGTGKTFNTINRALKIIDSDFYQQNREDRVALKEKFEEYKKAGQIEFITFHQSFSYEEFVEGIKAKSTDNGLEYKIESGIFKKLSKVAKENFENSKKTNLELLKEKTLKQKIEIFLNDALENGSEFVKTKGGKFRIIELSQDEITIFTEDSNYSDKKLSIPIDEFYKILESNLELKTSRQMAKDVFGINNQRQRDTYYFAMSKKFYETKIESIENIQNEEPLKNYILIIDEINRGNISKIFGELITLIEPSKRVGNDEEIRLKLPYSQELFGVPSNLYIIGTMNTADRSIALMDTALRRRFHFEEMMPNSSLLENLVVDGIKIDNLLEVINKRVEYLYDRDHTIGHAYFMSLENLETKEDKKAELENIFRNKIIPLLQEYFYDDWEKVRLVLGNGFVEKIEVKSDIFDEDLIKDSEYLEEEKFIYNIKKEFDFSKFKD
ncbi:MAG TPA: AAA family ATPase [Arcobacter skirrowii]|nr:AAA family ATPase [Aliarcobacter skirrowii]